MNQRTRSLKDWGQRLLTANHLTLASHSRPDGDAIGSLVALGSSLQELGKDVLLLNEDVVPDRLRFLSGSEAIQLPSAISQPFLTDHFIALDTSTPSRIGDQIWSLLPENTPVSVLDHHDTREHYGDHCFVDPNSPATGQLVFELIQLMGWPLSPAIADNLWTAIATDTGSFQFPATTAQTLEAAAALVRAGARVGPLSQAIFHSFPERRVRLLQRLLNTLDLRADGRLASWRMRASDLQELAIQPGDSEDLITNLRSIDTVIVAISFEESPADGLIRVSSRSKNAAIVNVAEICERFGGGGHQLAAGATLDGPLDEAAEKFLSVVTHEFEHGNH